MAKGSLQPGPFPANPHEVPYIVHSEEFINKCFLFMIQERISLRGI